MKDPSSSRVLDQLPLPVDSKATRRSTGARFLPARRAMVVLFGLIALTYIYYTHAALPPPGSLRDVDGAREIPSLGVSRTIQQSWAMYSPYYAAEPYVSPPRGCSVDQVHILQRHGARYPTSGAATRIRTAIGKLQSVDHYTDPLFTFLKNYTYDLGQDSLIPFGAVQSFQSGEQAFKRYTSLVTTDNQPFVRASSPPRVVDSANNWTAGFAAASHHRYNPTLSVILSEAGNDTLDDGMCAAAGSSDPQTNLWLSTFAPPLTARLNAAAPGANLTDADTYSLLSMCAFDTVAHERPSPFCALYKELNGGPGFAYTGDLTSTTARGTGSRWGACRASGT
ncbi:hypothetical protein GSI_00129 [Ganoderma sinense ZZ0214-1]|uniref:Uncharacterized protein n=1 Tax=Ganoderma sinense ZZ0214-1 TaxID=1077348 RepID=A0A2G8SRQ5_9APHY|nr:hypothetical protein GSI_00129 [Ganoderma sinense ZZ0214-1]